LSFYYLATPYSKYPEGENLYQRLNNAFLMACRQAALLIKAKVPVYSPIAHTHPIAMHNAMDPLDHGIWLPADTPMMEAARGLIVVKAPSWESSYGISKEIEHFTAAGKPILWMDVDVLPEEFK